MMRLGWNTFLRTAVCLGLLALAFVGNGWAQQGGTPAVMPTTPEAAPAVQAAPVDPAAAKKAKEQADQLEQLRNDWPNLKRFHDENLALAPPAPGEMRVVFMGDSITQGWMGHGTPMAAGQTDAILTPGPTVPPGYKFFPGKSYINRGISGQTTPQMLVRFRPDVVELKPSAVVILAGINDIAGNTGPMTLEATEDNLASMAEIAHENGIKVVLCSILPAFDFPWHRGLEPGPKVIAINTWMQAYAALKGFVYVDYYSAMVDDRGGLPATLSYDGVHPTAAGYAVMNPIIEAGIAKALAK